MRDKGTGRGAPHLRLVRNDGGSTDEPGCADDRVAQYLDGELADDAMSDFMTHLATCETCQETLHYETQLRDRLDSISAKVVAVPPLATSARGRRWLLLAGAPLAIAAVITLYIVAAPNEKRQSGAAMLALGPRRMIEARLGWPGAAKHRPYDTMRAQAIIGERIDPSAVAALAKASDCAGVAAAYVLAGELNRATLQYSECPPSLDLDADRAALAVARREPEEALELADRVLAEAPHHAVALWNRALALRDLGLGLAAAAAFDKVAALSDDWAQEASANAAALRAPLEQARRNWDDAVKAGEAMVAGGPVIPELLVRAVPTRARLRFDDAVRVATTADRLEDLRPLARQLERITGDSLTAAIDAAKRRLVPARAALVPMYLEMLRSPDKIDPKSPAWRAWRARAGAIGATDLLLGASYLAHSESEEALSQARATDDPWFIGLIEAEHASSKLRAGNLTAAFEHIRTLEALCNNGAPSYICLLRASRQALVVAKPAQVAKSGREMMEIAARIGEVLWHFHGVFYAAEGERRRGRYSAARGYYEELILLSDSCETKRLYTAAIGLLEMARDRYAVASSLSAPQMPCSAAPSLAELTFRGHLIDAGLAADTAEWRAGLRALLERQQSTPGEKLYAEFLGLRADLASKPQARAALLDLIQRAAAVDGKQDNLETAKRAKSIAETVLMREETRRGAWREALDIAAIAQRVRAPERCALALARSGPAMAAVMVGPESQLDGRYQPFQQWALPATWQSQLARCEEIAVLAFPGLQGQPALPPTLPWAYRSSGATPSEPESRVPSPHTVIVANSKPPVGLGLASLAPITMPADSSKTVVLTGAAATRRRVEAEAVDATLLEFHVHTARVDSSDAPVLALSEAPDGWALSAEQIEHWHLRRSPVVLLADCLGAVPAGYDDVGWGLPVAFRKAGARAVVAALTDIPDNEGAQVFAEIRARLRYDSNVARVVSEVRAEKIHTNPASWVRHIVVFQ